MTVDAHSEYPRAIKRSWRMIKDALAFVGSFSLVLIFVMGNSERTEREMGRDGCKAASRDATGNPENVASKPRFSADEPSSHSEERGAKADDNGKRSAIAVKGQPRVRELEGEGGNAAHNRNEQPSIIHVSLPAAVNVTRWAGESIA